MVDGGEDRCGDRDSSLFWSASCLEAQELGLEIGVLVESCQYQRDRVADGMRPRRRLSAHEAVAQEISGPRLLRASPLSSRA
jgi:hypothetical protein